MERVRDELRHSWRGPMETGNKERERYERFQFLSSWIPLGECYKASASMLLDFSSGGVRRNCPIIRFSY